MADISPEEMARRVGLAVQRYNELNPDNPITAQDIYAKDRSGFWGKAMLMGEGLWDGLTDRLPENMGRLMRGGDTYTDNSIRAQLAEGIIRANELDQRRRIPSLQEAIGDEDTAWWYNAPLDLPTNIAIGAPGSIAGGVLGAIGGPAGSFGGTVAGGAMTSYAGYYRIGKDKFISDMHEQFRAQYGREPTRAEAERLNSAADGKAREYANSQGVKEAAAQAVSSVLPAGARNLIPVQRAIGKNIVRMWQPGPGARGVMAAAENVANEAMSPERDTQAEQVYRELSQRVEERPAQIAQYGAPKQIRWQD